MDKENMDGDAGEDDLETEGNINVQFDKIHSWIKAVH